MMIEKSINVLVSARNLVSTKMNESIIKVKLNIILFMY